MKASATSLIRILSVYFMGFKKVKSEGKSLSVWYVCSRGGAEGEDRLRRDDLRYSVKLR